MSRGRAFMRAADVSVDTVDLPHISGRRVQEAVESIDLSITDTPLHIEHGTDANYVRPPGINRPVWWIGTVEPINSTDSDLWINPEEVGGGGGGGSSAAYVDTAANLAAANPVIPVGYFGHATDTDIVAFGDGTTAWNSLPKYESTANSAGTVLDVATTTVGQTGIITAPVDLTGLSITFTVGTRPVEVEMYLPFTYGTLDSAGRASIADETGTELRSVVFYPSVQNGTQAITVKELITTPGSYTRKGKLGRNGGAGTFANGIDMAQYTSFIKATVQ